MLRRLKKKNIRGILILATIIEIYGCSTNNKTIYNIPQEKLYLNEKEYILKYGIEKNVVVDKNNLIRIYVNGSLSEIGKQKKDKRIGYWYFFDDTLGLKYIINYKKLAQDTFMHPYSAPINQRW